MLTVEHNTETYQAVSTSIYNFDSSLTSTSFMLLASWQCDHQNLESINLPLFDDYTIFRKRNNTPPEYSNLISWNLTNISIQQIKSDITDMICKAENISPSYANTITESSTCIDNSNKILTRINHLVSNIIQTNQIQSG